MVTHGNVVKLVYTRDLKSLGAIHTGSSPVFPTKFNGNIMSYDLLVGIAIGWTMGIIAILVTKRIVCNKYCKVKVTRG